MSKSKFNIDKTEQGKLNRLYNGIIYDSEMELDFLKEVIEPQIASGKIIKYERQVVYELLPAFVYKGQKFAAINYKSDFNIHYADGTELVVDIKGLAKPLDIIKRKLLLSRYPNINYIWMIKSVIDGGWCDYEVVKKNRAKRKKLKKLKENNNGKI